VKCVDDYGHCWSLGAEKRKCESENMNLETEKDERKERA